MRHRIAGAWVVAGMVVAAWSVDVARGQSAAATPLVEARKGFKPKLVARGVDRDPVPDPPSGTFLKVTYPAKAGALSAYLTPDPKDGAKHPAIVWITGGDCNSVGDVWSSADSANDQTAAAYRQAGIVMMFPALRGGNDGPGTKEGFLGEVDDVLAATDLLAKQPYVDPSRIYLGGHSTGGTLVMLVAASTDRYRGVFSFGPVDDVAGYPPVFLPFDVANPREIQLRSPINWLDSIRSRTFVFEGKDGNMPSLQAMQAASKNPLVSFHPAASGDHFSILAPINAKLAQKILADTGPNTNIAIAAADLEVRAPAPPPARVRRPASPLRRRGPGTRR
ncbi:alpha/beta hydrolase family protein [Paludisphaera mucosa]|uniref:Prolyl oligopeptidase family serine peptidase n=1 Tax=Paludisphaera mucosa TaxID=3030827 RepID=A0ABT6FJX3_9BACT|nr:prolyl oligopeptidase family serine peptidase [Paludisphaera mucosa]MDG3007876.1 prolyl oligopeptidase family serine peptidase [Paludisphaera mucosa]